MPCLPTYVGKKRKPLNPDPISMGLSWN
jgi:hypothetical protein